jgi:hypothetical protein
VTAIASQYRLTTEADQASSAAAILQADRPLSAALRRELVAAREREKPIRKAARVAAFNGWTTAVVAALSAPFAVFDHSSFPLTVALAIVAYNELRGRRQLLNFDPRAATLLGWNQLGLLMVIVVYCLWSLWGNLGETGALSAELQAYADLDSALGTSGGFEGLYRTVTLAMYGGAVGLSVLFQGGNALYYFTRRRRVDDFVAETPQWIREVQSNLL